MTCEQSLRPISEPMARIEEAVRSFLANETAEAKAKRQARCDAYDAEQAAEKARARRGMACIPSRYTTANVGSVPELQGIDLSASMLMLGAQGRGKTYAACAVLNRRAAECVVRFATFDAILKELQATFNGAGNVEQVLSKYRNCACLAIDDFGKEKPTDYAIGQFFALLDWRIANGKQTIVTSNYSLSQLLERLSLCGERHTVAAIMSRLGSRDVENGGFQRIVFRAEDRRML